MKRNLIIALMLTCTFNGGFSQDSGMSTLAHPYVYLKFCQRTGYSAGTYPSSECGFLLFRCCMDGCHFVERGSMSSDFSREWRCLCSYLSLTEHVKSDHRFPASLAEFAHTQLRHHLTIVHRPCFRSTMLSLFFQRRRFD